MAGSDEVVQLLIDELTTESATAEIALSGIAVGGVALLATIVAPWWLRRRHDPLAESRSFAAIRWAVVAALFVVLTQQVQEMGWLTGADTSTQRWFMAHRTPAWSGVAVAVTEIGSPIGVSVIATMVGAISMWRSRSARPALVLLTIMSFTAGVNTLTKLAVGRLRPPATAQLMLVNGLSYPSGHTAGAAALAGAILLIYLPAMRSLVHRWFTVAAGVLGVVAVATSRLYLGVHWLTDVVGGMLLAVAVVLAAAVFVRGDAWPEAPTEDPGEVSQSARSSARDKSDFNPNVNDTGAMTSTVLGGPLRSWRRSRRADRPSVSPLVGKITRTWSPVVA
jgi:undecaprenyl-diphosphatase